MNVTEGPAELSCDEVIYDSDYYDNYNGAAYGRNKHWLEFFGKIAENISTTLKPRSVLDAGCAYGLLVETLRDRGIEAFGLDISEYAIKQARPDIQKFLWTQSLVEPIRGTYDLIVSIEVVEHIEESKSDQLIENLCNASERVLLATTPDDFDDPTHFNVNPPSYWINKFAKYGFAPDIDYDAGYLTPYAMLFSKTGRLKRRSLYSLFGAKKLQDLHFSRVVHESNLQRVKLEELGAKIKEQQKLIEDLDKSVLDSQSHIKNLDKIIEVESNARNYYQGVVEKYQSSFFWKMLKPIRLLERCIRACFPIWPKLRASADNTSKISFDAVKIKKWGLFVAKLTKNENVIFSLDMDNGSGLSRCSAVPLGLQRLEKKWLFRREEKAVRFIAHVKSNRLSKVSVLEISSLRAWLIILKHRWHIGHGFRNALKLAYRILKHLGQLKLGKVIEEIWPEAVAPDQDYDKWLAKFDNAEIHHSVHKWLEYQDYKPLISIVIPTFNSDLKLFMETIQSVREQSYPNWQICIADDASTDVNLIEWLKVLEAEEKVDVVFRKSNGHISKATNTALKSAKGEFVAFLDHDDLLHPHALSVVVGELNLNPNLDLIYSDEDKVDVLGNRSQPHFKPSWSPDTLLSQNYLCHLATYRRSIVEEVGGLREGFEGAQDYDLVLRVTERTNNISHVPHILYHWRATSGSTALATNQKDYAHESAKLALNEALRRRKLKAFVEESGLDIYHRVRYEVPSPMPRVSIIIPTKDHINLLKTCINGILNKTEYQSFEIIVVDNNSEEPQTQEYFENLHDPRIKVLSYPNEFNFSAINNFAVRYASGEVLVLLNNDVEVIRRDWLGELVSQAMRPDIGAVGARLYYVNDTVQHDGIVLGMGGVAGYAHPHLARSAVADFGGSRLIRNFSAVTAAALAIKKTIFLEVGGLDENNLAVAFNDVDFCLKVQQAGYRNLFTPYAELYHHESISRGPDTSPVKASRFQKEAIYMKNKWSNIILNDPNYNPNLSLISGFTIDQNRGQKWPWQD